jgi:hypothetical protein
MADMLSTGISLDSSLPARRSSPAPAFARVASIDVDTPRRKTLFEPGHEAEWARINEKEDRQEAEFAASLSMTERVAYGQKLSQQAVSLLVASVKTGHVPRRALWS